MLPWELREKEMALYDRLADIVRDATNDDEKSMSPTNFPFLFSPADKDVPDGPTVWDELKAGRFCRVQLERPFVDDDPEEHQYTWEELPGVIIDEGGDYSGALYHFMGMRSVQGKAAPRQGERGGHVAVIPGAFESYTLITELGKCFDLRGLCAKPCPLVERDAALTRILATAAAKGVIFDVRGGRAPLHAQLEMLRSRLAAAAKVYPYSEQWFDEEGGVKSGTNIMRDLLTTRELYADLGDILYVFQHAALKGRNEAVVEGMGSMVSMHADKTRGRLGFDQYSAEAIFYYNFPPLSHPASTGLICEALTLCFGKDKHGIDKPWHFKATSAGGQASIYNTGSKVTRRLAGVAAKHSFMTT
jgi:hypothetical protein